MIADLDAYSGIPAMNSRRRMLAAINREPVDRVPLDIWATGEVRRKLRDHFGSDEACREALHLDGFAGCGPRYVGPEVPEGEDMWGMRRRMVDYGTGAYAEQSYWPLGHMTSIEELDQYRWPRADWFDFSGIRDQLADVHEHRAVQAGYMAILFFHNQLRGLEQSLLDPYDDPEFTRHLLQKLSDYFHEYHRRLFEAADGMIDIAQVTDDLGTQTGPLLSLEVWREFYKPHVQRFIDLCREFNVKVFHHDDGAIRAFLPDLVELGIDVLNPIQWRCPGMELQGLKREFGHAVCFHGAIDNQETLPHGSPDDVRAEVRQCIDVLASDKTGYICAPCHNLQPVTPIENILAMYDEAWHYGRFE